LKAIVKIIIGSLFVILSIFGKGYGQNVSMPNNPRYDDKKYHFGFMLGINSMNFAIKPVDNLHPLDSLYGVESTPELGFNIGIVSDLRLGRFFNLRFIPSLEFGERTLNYFIKYHDNVIATTLKKVESTYIQFPLELKFKSERMTNTRAYVLTGLNYVIDLASQANKTQVNPNDIIVKLYKTDLLYEFGVGFDFYLTYFKMATELKMCYGLKDLLVHDQTLYSSGIDRLNSKIFQLSLTFE